MSDMQIERVLAQMRAIAERAGASGGASASEAPGSASAPFSTLLRESLTEVNAAQQRADDLSTRFAAGAADASLPEVMLSIQKASLELEAVTQVRNRLVAAYQEIMNMPV